MFAFVLRNVIRNVASICCRKFVFFPLWKDDKKEDNFLQKILGQEI